MILDIFHYLLKIVVGSTNILKWLKTIIGVKFKRTRVKASITKLLQIANRMVFSDKRFCAVSFYLIMMILKEYSKVKQ